MNRGFQQSWWLALIALGIQQAAAAGFTFACMLLGIENFFYPLLIFSTASLAVPIVIGGIWAVQDGGRIMDIAPLKRFSPWLVPYCIFLPVMQQQFMGFIMRPVNLLFYVFFGGAQESMPVPDSAGTFLGMFLVLCVAAPLFEEVLCRGVIMKLLEKYGFAVSVLVSACLFASLHMELQSILSIFFLGVLFAVARYATGSIWPSILMHAANNLFALLSLMVSETQWSGGKAEALMIMLLIILCPFTIWRFLKRIDGPWKRRAAIKTGIKPGMSAGLIIIAALVFVFNTSIFLGRLANGEMAADLRALFMQTEMITEGEEYAF